MLMAKLMLELIGGLQVSLNSLPAGLYAEAFHA